MRNNGEEQIKVHRSLGERLVREVISSEKMNQRAICALHLEKEVFF